eukprot:5939228-Amphidinium_carterae.1
MQASCQLHMMSFSNAVDTDLCANDDDSLIDSGLRYMDPFEALEVKCPRMVHEITLPTCPFSIELRSQAIEISVGIPWTML